MCIRNTLGAAGVAVALAVSPTTLWAQDAPAFQPVNLPDGPAQPGFDVDRFSNAGNGWFEAFYVEETEPLGQALLGERVDEETRVMVLATAAGRLALLSGQMGYHHIAQGRAGGKDWMATF